MPQLVKHDGSHEAFSRDKLVRGIRIACAKRPISHVVIHELATAIEDRLSHLGLGEISSRDIGDMVLEGLRRIDEVAYIRYALIYLELNDVGNVLHEVDRLVTIAR
jgi:transcriptional repressor NrdR